MLSAADDRPATQGVALEPTVATALRAQLPEVADRTVAAVISEVDEYAAPLRGELGRNITRAVESALATFLRLAEEPGGPGTAHRLGPALEAAYTLGRGEARNGRTMNALLSAYRVGARVAWEHWGTTALDAGLPAGRVVPLATLVFAYIDQLSAASVNGHADQLATTGRVLEQYREQLGVALLAGAEVTELERRAERADWPPPATLTCVLASSAHSAALRRHVGHATLSLPGDAVDPEGPADLAIHLVPDLTGRSALLPDLGGKAWVVGPTRPWHEVSASFRRARRELGLVGRSTDVVDTEAHLVELVVTSDADALHDLRTEALRPLAALKPDTAERLAETLHSWLLHQGRREEVAKDLIVHPQTVRYRMTQIRELYGDRLRDPAFVRQLIVALAAG